MKPAFHCDEKTGDIWYECQKCHERLVIDFPITALNWIAKAKEFSETHECPKATRPEVLTP